MKWGGHHIKGLEGKKKGKKEGSCHRWKLRNILKFLQSRAITASSAKEGGKPGPISFSEGMGEPRSGGIDDTIL